MKFNLDYKVFTPNLLDEIEKFAISTNVDESIAATVSEILQEVKTRGDQAIVERTLLYDGANLNKFDLRIPASQIKEANTSISLECKAAMKEAIENVTFFHQQNLPRNWQGRNSHGAIIGENYYPINRVGLYVPGGNVPLVSTVIMSATLAKVAGVSQIAVMTPPNPDGTVSPELLGALAILEVDEVYKVGGAQAIGALAYGTESVKAVDKIFGPGNAFVNEAKKQVFSTVGIDLLPGPSEVMVIADETANPAYIAAALLAQAEHGSGKEKIYLIFTKKDQFDFVVEEIKQQTKSLSHQDSILHILEKGFLAILTENLEEIVKVANFIAPEHLELQVKNEDLRYLQENINTAGALLLGHFSATALGDFVAGPSHVLPTGRSARFSSGLRMEDFFRRTSIIRYDQDALINASESALLFSEMEKLDGHGNSISIRLGQD